MADFAVKFGENTGDEMCFAIVAHYPKTTFLSWLLPTLSPTCVKN